MTTIDTNIEKVRLLAGLSQTQERQTITNGEIQYLIDQATFDDIPNLELAAAELCRLMAGRLFGQQGQEARGGWFNSRRNELLGRNRNTGPAPFVTATTPIGNAISGGQPGTGNGGGDGVTPAQLASAIDTAVNRHAGQPNVHHTPPSAGASDWTQLRNWRNLTTLGQPDIDTSADAFLLYDESADEAKRALWPGVSARMRMEIDERDIPATIARVSQLGSGSGDPAEIIDIAFGSDVVINEPTAVDTFGAWADLWTHTITTAGEYILFADFEVDPSIASRGGDDRVVVEYEIVRRRGAAEQVRQQTTSYVRNLDVLDDTLTAHTEISSPIDCAVGDIVAVEARVAVQVLNTGRVFTWRAAMQHIHLVRLSRGATGPAGPAGDTGPQGLQGPTGPQGNPGPQGTPGAKGDTGDTGPKGDKGDKGDTGDTGPKGDTGDTGVRGPAGPAGPAGPGLTLNQREGNFLADLAGDGYQLVEGSGIARSQWTAQPTEAQLNGAQWTAGFRGVGPHYANNWFGVEIPQSLETTDGVELWIGDDDISARDAAFRIPIADWMLVTESGGNDRYGVLVADKPAGDGLRVMQLDPLELPGTITYDQVRGDKPANIDINAYRALPTERNSVPPRPLQRWFQWYYNGVADATYTTTRDLPIVADGNPPFADEVRFPTAESGSANIELIAFRDNYAGPGAAGARGKVFLRANASEITLNVLANQVTFNGIDYPVAAGQALSLPAYFEVTGLTHTLFLQTQSGHESGTANVGFRRKDGTHWPGTGTVEPNKLYEYDGNQHNAIHGSRPAAAPTLTTFGPLLATSAALPTAAATGDSGGIADFSNSWTQQSGADAYLLPQQSGYNARILRRDGSKQLPDNAIGFWAVAKVGGVVQDKILMPAGPSSTIAGAQPNHANSDHILFFSQTQFVQLRYAQYSGTGRNWHFQAFLRSWAGGGQTTGLPANSTIEVYLAQISIA